MSKSRLPAPPDFEAIESFAGGTEAQRSGLWTRLGDLNFAWSNNESLLIYFIMLLLRTDEASAAIVFATLNTTRARLDLIERLARVQVRDRSMLKRIRSAVEEFNAITRIRNEINHCIFIVGEDGRITDTQSTRLQETRGASPLVSGGRWMTPAWLNSTRPAVDQNHSIVSSGAC